MKVITKDGQHVYEVFDITYDRNGYPHFLIYNGREWIRRSAKHFRPAIVKQT